MKTLDKYLGIGTLVLAVPFICEVTGISRMYVNSQLNTLRELYVEVAKNPEKNNMTSKQAKERITNLDVERGINELAGRLATDFGIGLITFGFAATRRKEYD